MFFFFVWLASFRVSRAMPWYGEPDRTQLLKSDAICVDRNLIYVDPCLEDQCKHLLCDVWRWVPPFFVMSRGAAMKKEGSLLFISQYLTLLTNAGWRMAGYAVLKQKSGNFSLLYSYFLCGALVGSAIFAPHSISWIWSHSLVIIILLLSYLHSSILNPKVIHGNIVVFSPFSSYPPTRLC